MALYDARNADLLATLQSEHKMSTQEISSLEQKCRMFGGRQDKLSPTEMAKELEGVFGFAALQEYQHAVSPVRATGGPGRPAISTLLPAPTWLPISKKSIERSSLCEEGAGGEAHQQATPGDRTLAGKNIIGKVLEVMADEPKKRMLQFAIQEHVQKVHTLALISRPLSCLRFSFFLFVVVM